MSSDFENALDAAGFGGVNAYTNGNTVWLYVTDLTTNETTIDLPSGYMPLSEMVVIASTASSYAMDEVTVSTCLLLPSTSGHPNGTLELPELANYSYTFTIIYPIA